jgi:2-amino-4-hydroxy-6-hydroxymethyldihydropteridine diphosphokinase
MSLTGKKHSVYLSLGSNLGDRLDYLHQAIEFLKDFGHVNKTSSVYETDPWGYEDQPAFYNQVAMIETELEPLELLHDIKQVELKMGRTPTFRYGPRVIDIDILLFDDIVFTKPELTIPHPEMKNRAFVLAPLLEIAPSLSIPGEKASIKNLLDRIGMTGIRKIQE